MSCTNKDGDCEILKISVRKSCFFHRNKHRRNKYHDRKHENTQKSQTEAVAQTPMDILTCKNCGSIPFTQRSPTCKRQYWNSRYSKYIFIHS